MINLPLPDEIIRKIYQFILPIFEYTNYIQNIINSNNVNLELCDAMSDYTHSTYADSVCHQQTKITKLSALSCLQLEYITDINDFLCKNPKFVRPQASRDLTDSLYKRQFDVEISTTNLERLEKNVMIRRGLWDISDTSVSEIMIYHDINELMFNGSIPDLIFSCIINNIHGFKEPVRAKISWQRPETKFRYEGDILNFVNQYYMRTLTRIPSRKTLIKKLMKL